MGFLDIDALAAAPLSRDPFDYLVLERFVRPETRPAIAAAYPTIAKPGSFTLDETTATMSWRTTVMTAAVSCPGVSIGALTIELTYSLTRP